MNPDQYTTESTVIEDRGFFHAATEICKSFGRFEPTELLVDYDDALYSGSRIGWGAMVQAPRLELAEDNGELISDTLNLALAMVRARTPEFDQANLEAELININDENFAVFVFTEQPDMVFPSRLMTEALREIKDAVMQQGWAEMKFGDTKPFYRCNMPEPTVPQDFVDVFFDGLNPYAALALEMLRYHFDDKHDFTYSEPTEEDFSRDELPPISIIVPQNIMQEWRDIEIKSPSRDLN